MNAPKISIITPTYNAENLIEACLLNVAAQSYEKREHLIIDNESTDSTPDIVRNLAKQHPHIRLVSGKDKGIYDALNKGIGLSSGEWVYILGSDDAFYDNHVLEDIFAGQETGRYDIIYGNVKWGKENRTYDGEFSKLKFMEKNICQQAIFYSSTLFSRFGKFEARYRLLADWVFNMQWFCREDVKQLYIDRIIAIYNPYGLSSQADDTEFLKNRASLIEQYFPEEYLTIFERDTKINELGHELSVRDTQISQLLETIKYREEENELQQTRIENLEGAILDLEGTINDLENKIHKLLSSSSWRMTKPVRKLSKSIRKRTRKIKSVFRKNNAQYYILSQEKENRSCDISTLHETYRILENKSLLPLKNTTDIILSTDHYHDDLPITVNSIVRNTSSPFTLHIIDDGSSDEQILGFIGQFQKDNPSCPITFTRNPKPAGLARNLNRTIDLMSNHIVLVYPGIEVPSGWLERLMAPIMAFEDVATATPFTNADTFCSFREFAGAPSLPEQQGLEDTDKCFGKIAPLDKYPGIPAGAGFCMAINRNIIDRIGMFDAQTFSREPGAEIDWSFNAFKNGYRNVLVPNLFIQNHSREEYFPGHEKQGPLSRHVQKIVRKYPGYLKVIKEYAENDPSREVRQLLLLLLLASGNSAAKKVLFLDHDLGGGANLFRKKYIKEALQSGEKIFLLLYNYARKQYDLIFYYNSHQLSFHTKNLEHIKLFLHTCTELDSIILSETVSFPNISALLEMILDLKKAHHTTLTTLIHDFFCVCPNFNLLNSDMIFCDVPDDILKCQVCLPQNDGDFRIFYRNPDIVFWRKKWSRVLNESSNIVCFSNSSKDILLKAYPALPADKIHVKPHKVDHLPEMAPAIQRRGSDKKDSVTIGILGNINVPKGARIVEKMVEMIEAEERNTKIVIIGRFHSPLKSRLLLVTGKYQHDELPQLIHKHQIDIFFTPSICPETFSFTTEEIIQMSLPLAVFNIGAPAERARHYPKGVIISKIDPETALDDITSFVQNTLTA